MDTLKILHVSDNGLPDTRIEKSAISAKKRGHEVYFAGGTSLNVNHFITSFDRDKIFTLNWNSRARYYYEKEWNAVKKQLTNIIKDCKPDLIHAHDVFAGKMCKQLVFDSKEIPMVYDSHEFWMYYVDFQYLENEYFKNIDPKHKDIPRLWRQWEIEIVDAGIPVITISQKAKEVYNNIGNDNAFVVPNYPAREETRNIPEPRMHDNFASVFVNGGKPPSGNEVPLRDIDGFLDLFNKNRDLGPLRTIGWGHPSGDGLVPYGALNRQQMYRVLCESDIGIIPWKPHPFHPYCSPNKAYEYAHAGLLPIIPASLKTVMNDLNGMAITFTTYDNLRNLITLFRNHPFRNDPDILHDHRSKIYRHARDYLTWDNYEGNIFDAYKAL
ncbi:MAG: glycosyltransferase [Candidatus Nitrosocosmicus sp.]|nr:glycosyltransferase [Candidatus Nitrosocosmicus sp.]MDN5866033.1 glycosyltransferase [Candidatus Nitrosocosmicus sp.]